MSLFSPSHAPFLETGCPKPRSIGGFSAVGPDGAVPTLGLDYFTRPEALIAHAQRLMRQAEQEAREVAAAAAGL